MNILIVDNDSMHLVELEKLLSKHTVRIITCQYLNQQSTDGIDLIVLTGGKRKTVMYGHKYYGREIQLIQSTKLPIIGICLGAEMIAYAFGAKMKKMILKKRGYNKITPIMDSKIFNREPYFMAFEAHRWAIKSLPSELEVLATSVDGIEVFRHKTKQMYGLQFHPEVNNKSGDGQRVFENIINLLNINK